MRAGARQRPSGQRDACAFKGPGRHAMYILLGSEVLGSLCLSQHDYVRHPLARTGCQSWWRSPTRCRMLISGQLGAFCKTVILSATMLRRHAVSPGGCRSDLPHLSPVGREIAFMCSRDCTHCCQWVVRNDRDPFRASRATRCAEAKRRLLRAHRQRAGACCGARGRIAMFFPIAIR